MPTWKRSSPKILTEKSVKTTPFSISAKAMVSSQAFSDDYQEIAVSFTHKKCLLSHLLDLQGVQFFNLKIKR